MWMIFYIGFGASHLRLSWPHLPSRRMRRTRKPGGKAKGKGGGKGHCTSGVPPGMLCSRSEEDEKVEEEEKHEF